MYNVVTMDMQGNVVTKVEPEEKVIFYIGNLMIEPHICKIQAYGILNSVDAFSWIKEDFYSLQGVLSEKVASYLDRL